MLCEAMTASSMPGTPGRLRLGFSEVRALADDGIVVFQKLCFLGVFQGDEDHRVTARGHHPSRQSDDRIDVAADLDAVTEGKTCGEIGDRLVMAAGDMPPADKKTRLAGMAGPVRADADDHGPYVVLPAGPSLWRIGRTCMVR